MSETFDTPGLLLAIEKVGETYSLPLPEGISFCSICLGANMPGQKEYPENGWQCGSWLAHFLPPLGICKNFKADKQAINALVKQIKPADTKDQITIHFDK